MTNPRLGFVESDPGDKNKDVAKIGHGISVVGSRGERQKTKATADPSTALRSAQEDTWFWGGEAGLAW
jgi:hypothetical protein